MVIIQVKIKLKFYYAMEQISSLIIDEFKDWKKSVLTDGQWDTLSSNKAKIEKRWLRYFPWKGIGIIYKLYFL